MKHYLASPMSQSILHVIFSAALLIVIAPVQLSAEVVDKVVAVVNNDVITLSELEAETAGIYQSIARKNEGGSMFAALEQARAAALNSMIDQRLVQQKAEQFNLSVSDEEVDNAFETMRDKLSLSEREFVQKLEESGLTKENYRNKLKASILQNKLLSIDVRSKIVITDEMVLDYYDENYTTKVAGGGYYLLQMGFNWDSDLSDQAALEASKKKAMDLARRTRKLAESGQDFGTLAKKFSDLPSAADGGDIGIFSLDDMAPTMRDAVSKLQSGEVSDIIEMREGYQFYKLLSSDDNAIVVTAPYEAVEDEIREKIYQQTLKNSYEDWVQQLKADAYIEIL